LFFKDRVLISPILQRHLTGEFEKKYIGTRQSHPFSPQRRARANSNALFVDLAI